MFRRLTRGVALLTALSFSLSGLASTSVQAASSAPVNGVYVCTTGVLLTSGDASPTYTINGGVVTTGDSCTGEVVIPDGVHSLGSDAFKGATALTSIDIPASVTSIGSSAFNGATSLTSITFAEGSSLTIIGHDSFVATALTSITIPAGVTSLGDRAFASATALTSVTIPAGVTSISDYAFYYATALTSVTIPAGVTSIGLRAFQGSGLTSITIPAGVTSIGDAAFYNANALKDFYLQGNAPSVGPNTFGGNANEATAHIRATATGFGAGPTWNGLIVEDDLYQVTFNAAGGTSVTSGTFIEGGTIQTAPVSTRAGYTLAGWSETTSGSVVTFPYTPGVTTNITLYAIWTLSSGSYVCTTGLLRGRSDGSPSYTVTDGVVTSGSSCAGAVVISEGIHGIGSSAFYESLLTSITIPSSVTSIGSSAFYGSSLTSITIPAGVTSIEDRTFQNATALTSITIPAGVTSIGLAAFTGANSLKDVYFLGNIAPTSVGDYAFAGVATGAKAHVKVRDFGANNANWNGLVVADWAPDGLYVCTTGLLRVGLDLSPTYTITNGVVTSGTGCTSAVVIPAGVTSIGNAAFFDENRDASRLTSVTFPESLTNIGSNAFQNATALTSITIPSAVTSIGIGAFLGNSNLQTVTFAQGSQLKEIPEWTFAYASSITSITIPASVTSIGFYAFVNASSLTDVYFAANAPTSVSAIAFSGVASGAKAHISFTATGFGAESTFNDLVIVRAADTRATPTVTDWPTASGITYGEALSQSILTGGSASFGITSVAGSFAFANPATTPNAGSASYQVVFTPTDTNTYAPVTSSGDSNVSVVVAKATPTISWPTASSITYGQALSDATLTGGSASFDQNSVAGSFAFANPATTPNTGNASYQVVFTPTDTDNYASVTSVINEYVSVVVLASYTVTYSAAGGTTVTSGSFVEGGAIQTASVSTRPGYTLDGWSTTAAGSVITFPYSPGVNANITLHAIWTLNNGRFKCTTGLPPIDDETSPTYTITNGVVSTGSYCAGAVVIPDGVTSIGNNAFDGATSVTSITIPDGVTSIGNFAFDGATSLTSITIPSSVTSLGDRAFAGANALTSIIIPASVTAIGVGAFANAISLTSITVDSGNQNFTSVDGVLFNDDATTLIQYPIGKSGTSYSIPASVTSIGEGAFAFAASLTSITIPTSVTSIGDYAFYGTSALTSIIIPTGVTTIRDFAFAGTTALASVEIPASVTSIGQGAFAFATALTSITIPAGVTSIDNNAFYGTTELEDVYFLGDAPTFGTSVFANIATGAKAHISATASGFGTEQTWNGLVVSVTDIATYTVTYNAAGGTPVSPGSFTIGGTIQAKPVSTRAGYTLTGWSTTANGTVVNFPYRPTATSNIKLYAIWTRTKTPTTIPKKTAISSYAAKFSKGSSVIPQTGKTAIGKIVSKSGKDANYTVTGVATRVAGVPDSHVKGLAKVRAEKVKAYLIGIGVKESNISIAVKILAPGITPKTNILAKYSIL